jgi:hypothetical protein
VPSTSDERALATALAELDDASLADLLTVRSIPAGVSWRDLFDAAEGMLEPAVVSRALAALPHVPATALAEAVRAGEPVAEPLRASLRSTGFVDADGVPFAAVAAAVGDRIPALVSPDVDATEPEATPEESAAAAERAFTHTASLADILLRAIDAPLTRIGNGGLGATERRLLVESGAAPDADTAELLLGIAAVTGLLTSADRAWRATPAAREWMTASTLDRWAEVAGLLRDALPPGLRTEDGGWIPAVEWPRAYPFDAGWADRSRVWRFRAEAWGLVTSTGASTPWAAPLAAGAAPDIAALQGMLPPEVDRVYLQNDLTAIAPGPLAPALDMRLRSMARRESRAQASSYRFDADTIAAAFAGGETSASMRAFLGELSLTGLPQPLDYLIERTASRHGLVRVSVDHDTGRARVSSDDPATIDTIAVDQALRPLGLVREGWGLVSRVSDDAVFWALADARYPVLAVDTDGEPRRIERAKVAPAAPKATPIEVYAELLQRMRAGANADGDSAWLERELDQAVRARALVDVVVALPDGSTRTFRLEATGLGGGRLRGRDRGADVERTLPLRSIHSVHPVG